MQAINLKKSLYWRLSLTFLIMLLFVGCVYIVIATISSNKYHQETTQRLNAEVAEYLLKETPPFKDGAINEASLHTIMHSMMAVNPGIEVYLISPDGEILTYVVLDKKVKLSRIDTTPLKDFISSKGETYVLADDPRNPAEKTIFSAAEVNDANGFLGYVYIVLASEKYENIAQAIAGSYWLKTGVNSLIITLIAAFSVGLILIWLLTKNLRVIIQTVNQFKEGDLNARIPDKASKGELATLAGTFNSMADTILKNIEDLKEVDQLRRELIANVSHDLRNPLAIIHGYIETLMIKADKLSKEEMDSYLKIVLESSNKLKRLVSDLFELSKLEAGEIKITKEPVQINDLLNDANRKFSLLSKQKNIKVKSDISDTIPMIQADVAMIDRVIQNLLDNAIKYTPKDGEILISANKKNNNVEIRIGNSGKGIPPEELPHIFDRYYMVDKEQKGIEGTGLGLAIVKKILEVHQSEIKVESKADSFTNFYFELPAHSA